MVSFISSTRPVARSLSSVRPVEILGSPASSVQKGNALRQATASRPRLLATLLRSLSAFAV